MDEACTYNTDLLEAGGDSAPAVRLVPKQGWALFPAVLSIKRPMRVRSIDSGVQWRLCKQPPR